jgi:hypothetical protein
VLSKNVGARRKGGSVIPDEFVFQDLIAALQDAVIQANAIAQKAALRSLDEYFDENHNPRTVTINLPSRTEAQKVQTVTIPVITLVPLSGTVIDRLSVAFDVQFSSLMREAVQAGNGPALFAQAVRPPERHRLLSLFARRNEPQNTAHIEIQLKGTDPPEALVRINDDLLRYLP